MDRMKFRKRLQEMITAIETALVLDGLPSVASPVPGLPTLRSYDLGTPEGQREVLKDLEGDIEEIRRDMLRQEASDDSD